jgi:hypothetical protein
MPWSGKLRCQTYAIDPVAGPATLRDTMKDRCLSTLNDDFDPSVFDFAAHARRVAVIG